MASIDLPRPLQDYFAFAETTPTREGRRFSITLPYLRADGRIDRLQWWYHLSEGKEKILGEEALRGARAEAIERFTAHVQYWLHSTVQTLHGEGPIPQLCVLGASAASGAAAGAFTSPVPVPVSSPEVTEPGAEASAEVPARPQEPPADPSAQVPQSKTAFG